MLKYNTSLPYAPPKAPPSPPARSPFTKYGSAHDDVLRAQMGSNNADYEVEAAKAVNEYDLKQMEARNRLVLAGIQQMNETQQQQNSLRNTGVGMVSSVLSGLFG